MKVNPAARTYQRALFEQGIPLTAFAVDDIQDHDERMKASGVAFQSEPPRRVVRYERTRPRERRRRPAHRLHGQEATP